MSAAKAELDPAQRRLSKLRSISSWPLSSSGRPKLRDARRQSLTESQPPPYGGTATPSGKTRTSCGMPRAKPPNRPTVEEVATQRLRTSGTLAMPEMHSKKASFVLLGWVALW